MSRSRLVRGDSTSAPCPWLVYIVLGLFVQQARHAGRCISLRIEANYLSRAAPWGKTITMQGHPEKDIQLTVYRL